MKMELSTYVQEAYSKRCYTRVRRHPARTGHGHARAESSDGPAVDIVIGMASLLGRIRPSSPCKIGVLVDPDLARGDDPVIKRHILEAVEPSQPVVITEALVRNGNRSADGLVGYCRSNWYRQCRSDQ